MLTLQQALDELTKPGELFESIEDGAVICHACAHRCKIRPGQRGACLLRYNQNGQLFVPWGYVASAQTDPIEKKPFSHLLPGSDVLTFGMLGCNFHCDFCQNWVTSQALREKSSRIRPEHLQRVSPEQITAYAIQSGASIIASSYNEPLITSEWAAGIFRQAKQAGLRCAFVSDGFATPEVLAYRYPYLDAFKVDLKTMQESQYRKLGGKLQNVLETIQQASGMGMWVEVVTLVIPGFNDSPQELWEAARFLVSVSPDIPWHVTAFHPDYRMTSSPPTSAETLQQAADIGQEAGLHHVYAGNLPGRVGTLEDTLCPSCQAMLIKRRGYRILEYHLTAAGSCPRCGKKLAGIWTDHPESVRLQGQGFPRKVIW